MHISHAENAVNVSLREWNCCDSSACGFSQVRLAPTSSEQTRNTRVHGRACAYIHAVGICHRDIKPENYMLTRDDKNAPVKLIDFDTVQPWESIIIGLIGGFVYQGASMLLRNFGLDDVVDAVPVHGACGVWGLVALGFFGEAAGVSQFVTQAGSAVLIIAWVGGLSTAILLPLMKMGMLRMDDATQDAGADAHEHYPQKAYTRQQSAPLKAGGEREMV